MFTDMFESDIMRSQGFCGFTNAAGGDCNFGPQGQWPLNVHTVAAAEAQCLALCESCARCRYFSFSLTHQDCSWFHDCALWPSDLLKTIPGFHTVNASEVREADVRTQQSSRRSHRLMPPPLPPLDVLKTCDDSDSSLDPAAWEPRAASELGVVPVAYGSHELCSATRLTKEYRPCPAVRAFATRRVLSPSRSSPPLDSPFNAAHFLRLLGNATVSFLGDSLVRQQFNMLACMLSPFADLAGARGAQYWSSTQKLRTSKDAGGFVRLPFRHEHGRVLLQQQWIHGRPFDEPGPTDPLSDVDPRILNCSLLVFGIGAFIPAGELRGTLHTWLRHLRMRLPITARVLWLEYFGGHFDTPTGEFASGIGGEFGGGVYGFSNERRRVANGTRRSLCKAIDDEDGARAHVRHALGNALSRAAGLGVWPTLNLSLRQPGNHPELAAWEEEDGGDYDRDNRSSGRRRVTDCRHFCFPGSVLEVRTAVLYNLLRRGCVHELRPLSVI